MAYSSAYCKGKMNSYASVIERINGLSGKISGCTDAVSSASKYTDKLLVCGKPIDNGKLATVGADIGGIPGMLSPVIAECNKKIDEWYLLYLEALAREEEENK